MLACTERPLEICSRDLSECAVSIHSKTVAKHQRYREELCPRQAQITCVLESLSIYILLMSHFKQASLKTFDRLLEKVLKLMLLLWAQSPS